MRWKSPFGGNPVFVSFARTRLFVFWSKNPAPFEHVLDTLDRCGYAFFFLFTLNDYETEGLEPHVSPLDERIETFRRLSGRIGKGRVVWRFDPIVLSDSITINDLLGKIRYVGDRIAPYTHRLIFSFVEIAKYRKVRKNLNDGGHSDVREFSEDEIAEFCEGLRHLNERWGLSVTACANRHDLSYYGIGRGQCISYDLIRTEFSQDAGLMNFLHPEHQQTLTDNPPVPDPSRWLKDPGQRNTCRCIVAKDIGQYSTCMHLCSYCYANTSSSVVQRNYARYLSDRKDGIFRDTITG